MTEHIEQTLLVTWWRAWAAEHKYDPKLLFAIPNGANKTIAQAIKFREEGLLAGVADLFLAIPMGGLHGLWIEMKKEKGGHWRPEQKEFCVMVQAMGYGYVVAKGADMGIRLMKEYLSEALL